MFILGLTGGIGHGKTTFGAYLGSCTDCAQNFESSLIISEVANDLRLASPQHPLPHDLEAINEWLAVLPGVLQARVNQPTGSVVATVTDKAAAANPEHFTKLFEYLELMQAKPELQTGEIDATNKDTFRPLLQWLGGYLPLVTHPGVWYDEIIRRIQQLEGIDLVTIGGLRYPADAERVQAAGGLVVQIDRPAYGDIDTLDLTERDRNAIIPNVTVINDGALEDLQTCAQQLYRDLTSGQLGQTYSASKVSQ
jgi:hypothetical protein